MRMIFYMYLVLFQRPSVQHDFVQHCYLFLSTFKKEGGERKRKRAVEKVAEKNCRSKSSATPDQQISVYWRYLTVGLYMIF